MAYKTGALNAPTSYNFLSTYDTIKPDVHDELVLSFGRQRFTGLLDMVGQKVKTTNITYDHYERDRTHPKIKATNGGTGNRTFTVDSSANVDYTYATSPYIAGTTPPVRKANPVKTGDLILVKPASGTLASSGNYIECIVTDVAAASSPDSGFSGVFTAYPVDGTQAIPAISTADEIIIIGSAHGEGSGLPEHSSFTTTKYSNNIQIFKDVYRATDIGSAVENWFTDPKTGMKKWTMKGETDAYDAMLNKRELGLLIGNQLTNSAVAEIYAEADTPLAKTKGVIPSILEDGNTYNYNSVTGLTIQDIYEMNETFDQQKGSKENLFMVGIALDHQLDQEFGDRFANGGISYGNFNFDQDKKVSLGFSSFKLGSYTYHKRCLDAFNDLQSLGADGYGYKYEGMIIPMGGTVDGRGYDVPAARMRYLEQDGANQEMSVHYVNGEAQWESGTAVHEVRYISRVGIEMFGLNRYMYVKRI